MKLKIRRGQDDRKQKKNEFSLRGDRRWDKRVSFYSFRRNWRKAIPTAALSTTYAINPLKIQDELNYLNYLRFPSFEELLISLSLSSLPEGDRTSYYEESFGKMQANKEKISSLRREVHDLRLNYFEKIHVSEKMAIYFVFFVSTYEKTHAQKPASKLERR